MKPQDRNTGLLKTWLADQLIEEIKKGVYQPGEFLDPVRRLCEKYDVSHITVQAALRELERQDLVERHPRKGILVKSSRAAGVADWGSPASLDQLVFLRWNASVAFTEQVEGSQRYCNQAGISMTVLDAGQSHERMLGYLKDLPSFTRGVMLVPFVTPEYSDAIAALQASGIPVVCLTQRFAGIDVSSIAVDDFSCGCLAVNHLMQQADQPVWYIGHNDARHAGWKAAMQAHGIDNVADYEVFFDTPEDVLLAESVRRIAEIGERLAGKIFKGKKPADGWSIYAFNDHCARGVYSAARTAGLEIGKDVLVVGGGDYPFCTRLRPALSSIQMSRQVLGYNGARLLHSIIAQQGPKFTNEVMPVHLVARGSSGASEIESHATNQTSLSSFADLSAK